LQKVFSTQLNLNINLSVFLFRTQLGTSEPVKDWHALTTSMLFCDTKCVAGICECVVGFCEIAACSRIFGQNTKSLIILSTATGEYRFCWYFEYAISSNFTFSAYTHGRLFRGGGRVPLNNWNEASIGLSPQNMWYL